MTSTKNFKIGVIGGSLGGLFTGIALHEAGYDVCIFEKTSEELKDRGAGIVMQPELIAFFRNYEVATLENIVVPIFQRHYLDRAGSSVHVDKTPQLMTAWGTIFHQLIRRFPASKYHYGYNFKNLIQQNNQVIALFENGDQETFDLLIGADGIHSRVRQAVFPEIQPTYAGYVGWRGIVAENEIAVSTSKAFIDRFTFYNMPNSHILCYLIPGNNDETTAGNRRLNWVWYWNIKEGAEIKNLLTDIHGKYRSAFVPEGLVKPEYITEQRQIAEELMPPVFKELIRATKNPFLQPITDLAVNRMYLDRVVLVGDAAFTPRPHTAASTAKAVSNAVSLAEALKVDLGQLERALATWEKPQLQMGNFLKKRGMALGNQSQFGFRPI